jgi:dTDP-4-dehydrorhamnose reductase
VTRIVLLGRSGQVGWELERALLGLGDVLALGRDAADLRNPSQLAKVVGETRPAFIINAAAYTDVEAAESNEADAFAVNGAAVGALAEAAHSANAVLVHFSTDYVFDGNKNAPYEEDDPMAPLSVYGRSKLAGEAAIRAAACAHLILRTSWVYAARGRNFLRTILRLAQQKPELRIVDDQIGAPTTARLIAEITAQMVHRCLIDRHAERRVRAGASVNLTAGGATSWFGFAAQARELAGEFGIPFGATLLPIPSSGYPTKAQRPRNSRLSLKVLERDWSIVPPSWQTCLRLCLEEIAAAGG